MKAKKDTNQKPENFIASEKGNIFFTLFGAVALVGVLGAGIMATMRGPLSTVVEVNRRTQAESQMAIASRLAVLEAVQAGSNGDCDGDDFVEPLEYKDQADANLKPVGGGNIPDAVAVAKNDPWGTPYGYCVWDAGGVTNADVNCDDDGSTSYERLAGTGDNDDTYTVIALVSAAADRQFDTTCTGGASPDVTKAAGSDDIIVTFTYQSAVAASGGLWTIKSSDPTTAEIAKNIEAQGATFSGALQLGASSMFLPTQAEALDSSCDGPEDSANYGILRMNNSTNPDQLEMCDSDTNSWVAVGASSSLWEIVPSTSTDIQYSSGNVGINTDPDASYDLHVLGNTLLDSGNLRVASGQIQLYDGSLAEFLFGLSGAPASITSDGTTLEINEDDSGAAQILVTNGEVEIDVNLDVDNDTIITGSTADNTAAALAVEDSANSSTLYVRNDGNVGIGTNSPSAKLDVTGDIETSGSLVLTTASDEGLDWSNADIVYDTTIGGIPNAGLSFDVGGLAGGFQLGLSLPELFITQNAITLGGQLRVYDNGTYATLVDITNTAGSSVFTIADDGDTNIAKDLDVASTIFAATYELDSITQAFSNVPDCDAATEKIVWTAGTGWGCDTDLQGGSGGGAPTLDDIGGVFERSGTVVLPNSGVVEISTDDFVFGSYELDDDNSTTNDTNRFFFDKSKGAFRAGEGDPSRWNSGNIGDYSMAWGAAAPGFIKTSNMASGIGATAFGGGTTASGDYSTAWGGGLSTNTNDNPVASGERSTAFGAETTASGNYSTAWGFNTGATADYATAFGNNVEASGEASIAIGLRSSLTLGYAGEVSGNESIVFFMGDQTGVDVSTSNVMALLGGTMIINPDSSSASPAVPSTSGVGLELHVEGDVGADNYCDTSGANCFTASSVSGGGSSVFVHAGTLVSPDSATVDLANDDFVFGSYQLDSVNPGVDNFDARMFFDKSLQAFRAGYAINSSWNETNVGTGSAAMGANTTASGNYSFAVGNYTTASETGGVAMGDETEALGRASFAMGRRTSGSFGESVSAGGDYSFVYGVNVATGDGTNNGSTGSFGDASGSYSVAWGLGEATGNQANWPTVTGFGSYGIFMGNQAGADVNVDNVFSLIGGSMLISPGSASAVVPSTAGVGLELHVEGDVGADQYCDTSGANCFTPASVSGDGSGTGLFVREGTVVLPNSSEVTISTDDFVFGSTQLADTGTGNEDTRFFFDKSAGAFRAGSVDGTQWDSVGNFSVAFGHRTQATGTASMSWGEAEADAGFGGGTISASNTGTTAWGFAESGVSGVFGPGSITSSSVAGGSTAFGYAQTDGFIQSTNQGSTAFGHSRASGELTASGQGGTALGYSSGSGRAITASGQGSIAAGYVDSNQITASGKGSFAFGYSELGVGFGSVTASGRGSIAMGTGLTAGTGNHSIAFGHEASVTGTRSLAIGLGDSSTTFPTVSAADSMGIFMGNQANVNVNASNVMALLGGSMIINPDTTSASPAVPSTAGVGLELHVEGDVGADNYCDTSGANCFTASSVSGGSGSGLFIVESNVVLPDSSQVDLANDDFVFGSDLLESQAGADDDNRFFFDKSKAAFRAGSANNTRWDDGNVGSYSIAMGELPMASGDYSLALGRDVLSSGDYSYTIGRLVRVDGGNSMALGLGAASSTHPNVTGDSSLGIFMGDQDSVDVSSDNVMSILGASVLINPDTTSASPAVPTTNMELDVVGDININTYADAYRIEANPVLKIFEENSGAAYSVAIGTLSEHAVFNTAANRGNVFIGDSAGDIVTDGNSMVMIGRNAGSLSDSPSNSVFIGTSAGQRNEDGANNVFIGTRAGRGPSTYDASNNVFIGYEAGENIGGADNNNIFIGSSAGNSLTDGSNNLIIGSSVDVPAATTSNYLNIGGIIFGNTSNGKVGAVEYCDEDLANCFSPASVGGGSSNYWLYDSANNILTPDSSVGDLTNDDFVFGSYQLADTGTGNEDARFFFDKSKGAFRAGSVTDTRWDDGDVGNNSIALGRNPRASGAQSIAIGSTSSAAGADSVAIGSIASTSSSASTSIAMGRRMAVNGSGSIGMAAQTTAVGSNATLSAGNSVGFFIGNQGGVDVNVSNVFSILGASVLINPDSSAASPAVPTTGYELDVIGDIRYEGVLTDASDIRLKDNIQPLNTEGSFLSKINDIQTYSFVMKNSADKRTEYGVIAQELEDIFPDLVWTDAGPEGYKSVNYIGLIAPIIEATKELAAENQSLKAEIKTMKTDIALLKKHTGLTNSQAYLGFGFFIALLTFFAGYFINNFQIIRKKR